MGAGQLAVIGSAMGGSLLVKLGRIAAHRLGGASLPIACAGDGNGGFGFARGEIKMPQCLFGLVENPQHDPARSKISLDLIGDGLGGMTGGHFIGDLRLVHIQQFAGDQTPLGPKQSALTRFHTMRDLDELVGGFRHPVTAAEIFDTYEQSRQILRGLGRNSRDQFVGLTCFIKNSHGRTRQGLFIRA